MTPWRWILRQWRVRPGRAVAAVVAVAIAVAAVVATWVSADASRDGYRAVTAAVDGLPAVEVAATAGGRFDYAMLPRLADVPGVRAVVPQFFRPTILRHGETRLREGVLGVDIAALVDLGLLELSAGEACFGTREVVMDASLAAGLGVAVGDELVLLVRRGPRRVTITGLAAPASLASFSQGGGVVMDITALADLSVAAGQVDRVRLVLAPGADRAQVLAAVASRLPPEVEVRIPAGRAAMAEDVMHAADLGLDFVTALTVAMAWFIVANAMLMSVSERRRSLSLTRLLGATSRQVRRLIAGEAAVLGAIGAVVGASAGIAAAMPIARKVSAALQAGIDRVHVDPLVVVVATLLGPLVAVAAAWWPARQAGEVDLLESLAHAPPPAEPRVSWRFVGFALGLWALAAAILAAVVAEWLPPRAAVPAGILMLLAYIATTPVFLAPLVRLAAACVPDRWRIEGRLAREQILRQPVRTAMTTGVLVVAVSNGVGLGHAIRDNVDDMLGWYARSMRADWVLMHAGSSGSAVDTEAAIERLRGLDGVARVEAVAIAPGTVAGGPCVVIGRDMPDDQPLPLAPAGGDEATLRAALARGEAAAGTALARRAGVTTGAILTVDVRGRSLPVTIGGLVVDYTSGGSSIHLRRDAARRLFGIENADYLLVTAAPGRVADLAGPLGEVGREFGLVPRSFGDLRAFIDRTVGGVVGSLWAILGLGFAVGSLGVANTVAMNVAEQRRTLGLMRTLGMTTGQVTRLVCLQSLMLGAVGCVVGALGGLVTAAFIQLASQPLLGHPITATIRPTVIAANVAGALLVTALAAVIPARRAARLDLLEAIATD